MGTLYEARGGGGRALVELISHLSHLTVWGWLYLVVCIVCAIGIYFLLDKYIPIGIKKVTKQRYPFFSWVAIPQYKLSISSGIFLILFCFLGYFGIDDDAIFFICLGGLWLFFLLVGQRTQHSFMLNQGDFYMSKFALFGIYQKINPSNWSLDGDSENRKVTVKQNGKRICRIRLDYFSHDAQKYLRIMFKDARWTSV